MEKKIDWIGLDRIGIAPQLFGPLANLISLMGGKNLPVIHRIIKSLSTVPLESARDALVRLEAMNAGVLEYVGFDGESLGEDPKAGTKFLFRNMIGRDDSYRRCCSELVVNYFSNIPMERPTCGERKVAIGTLRELFGSRFCLPEASSVEGILRPEFLKAHGLQLCTPLDALASSTLPLEKYIRLVDKDDVTIATAPIPDLERYAWRGKPGGSLFTWRLRNSAVISNAGREAVPSQPSLRLETTHPDLCRSLEYGNWMFRIDESDIVV